MCAAESSDRWNERQAASMAFSQCDRDNPEVAIGKPRPILDILRDGCDPQYGTWAPICRRAVEEIERLREQLRLANIDNFNTSAEVAQLRKDLDHARWVACDQHAGGCTRNRQGKMEWFASKMGWLIWKTPCSTAEAERFQREINAMSNTQGDTIAKEGTNERK